MKYRYGICKEGHRAMIVNATHSLCAVHNRERLDAQKTERTPDLILVADAVFSTYNRLRYADGKGECKCFTCPKRDHWTKMQNGHFIRRRHHRLRFDEKNNRPQCNTCNCLKDGNEIIYREELVKIYGEHEVSTMEHSKFIEKKWTQPELKSMIEEWKYQIKLLKKGITV